MPVGNPIYFEGDIEKLHATGYDSVMEPEKPFGFF